MNIKRFALGCLALVGSSAAFATDDFATVIAAVDFASVTTGVLAIGALIVGVMVILMGLKFVYRALRGN